MQRHYITQVIPAMMTFVSLLAIPGASASLARDIYVDNVAGDDLLDGAVSTHVARGQGPFHSLARALRSATAGDRILLANTGQPYRESVSLVGSRHSGTAYQPFVIEGQGAVMDGSRPVPKEAWQFFSGDVFRFSPQRKEFQQLFLNGLPLERVSKSSPGQRIPKLEPKQWALVEGLVYFRVEFGKLPEEYPLSYTALSVGITLYKTDDVIIHNLIVQGFQLDGINLHDATGPCRLLEVTARGNGRSGVAVVGASNAELRSCLIGNNGQCQVLVDDYSRCDVYNCEVIGNTGPKWQVGPHAKLSIDGNPAQANASQDSTN